MSERLSVALIATVMNERASLDAWLTGIARQSRVPDEIVIVDGGSDDGTWETLSAWNPPCRFTLRQHIGASISAGRNLAMRQAQSDIIAVTDAGTVAHVDWLALLCRPFENARIDVSCGFFQPDVDGVWERALAATILPDIQEIRSETFLPSSRSVAIRSRWVRHGFEYPEWLDYCEDLVWDLQLKRAGARFELAPGAVVSFAVRPNWLAFWRQYYRYARGDGKAGLFTRRHLVRYLTYITGAIVAYRRKKPELIVCGIAGSLYLRMPVVRLLARDRRAGIRMSHTLASLLLIPLHRLIGDLAKMAGYPAGIVWRLRQYGRSGASSGWQRIRPDGTSWHPLSTTAETPRRGA